MPPCTGSRRPRTGRRTRPAAPECPRPRRAYRRRRSGRWDWLWPADAQLAPRDRDLPQLATLLDADALRSAIQSCLPQVRLRSATPTYVRYKPGTNCLVAFELIAAGMDHPIK